MNSKQPFTGFSKTRPSNFAVKDTKMVMAAVQWRSVGLGVKAAASKHVMNKDI